MYIFLDPIKRLCWTVQVKILFFYRVTAVAVGDKVPHTDFTLKKMIYKKTLYYINVSS